MMKKFLRKSMGLFLAVSMLAATVTACGQGGASVDVSEDIAEESMASVEGGIYAIDEHHLSDGSCDDLPSALAKMQNQEMHKIFDDWHTKLVEFARNGDVAGIKSLYAADLVKDKETIDDLKFMYSNMYSSSDEFVSFPSDLYCYNDTVMFGTMYALRENGSGYSYNLHLVKDNDNWIFPGEEQEEMVQSFRENEEKEFFQELFGDSYNPERGDYTLDEAVVLGKVYNLEKEVVAKLRFSTYNEDGSLTASVRIINNSDMDFTNIHFGEKAAITASGYKIISLDEIDIDPAMILFAHSYVDLTITIPADVLYLTPAMPQNFIENVGFANNDDIHYDTITALGYSGFNKNVTIDFSQEQVETHRSSMTYPANYIKYSDTTSMFWENNHPYGNEAYQNHDIKKIIFENTLAGIPEDAWDGSKTEDGRVMCYVTDGNVLHIAGEGGVTAVNCFSLFGGFDTLEEIEFNGCFYTDPSTSFNNMFYDCEKLKSLDLSFMNTSNGVYFKEMFWSCDELESLNVSSFDTSNATTMEAMFYGCEKLTSLDVSNFDTTNVTNMNTMFGSCLSLSYLKLGTFNTENVTDARYMFEDARSLTSIDGNLSFPAEADTENMFVRSGME